MTTKNDNRFIHLDPNHMGVGDILSEVTRAYLYTGNPSAFVQRLLEGVHKYRTQTDNGDTHANREDRTVMSQLDYQLRLAYDALKKMEEQLYPQEEDVYEVSETPSVIPTPLPNFP